MEAPQLRQWRSGDMALDEYQSVQFRISEFDKIIMTVKSWSITSSGVAIGIALVNEVNALFLIGSVSAGLFWYLEALNKVFQTALIQRSRKVERMIRGELEYDGVRTSDYFRRVTGLSGPPRALWIMLYNFNVSLPHGPIVFAGLILYFFDYQA